MAIPSRKQFNKDSAAETIRKAAERWPSSFIPRSQVPKFTGGLIAVGTLANNDSAGTGIEGAFRVGRQICYPVDSVCDWLISRLEVKR
jgi:hypothetical protein